MFIRKLLHICLALIFLLNLFGCVTSAASKWAEKKASVPISYRKIVDVHPVAVREDDNINICIKLPCESEDCKEKNYLVSLPFNSLASGKIKPEKEDLEKFIESIDPYLPIYWYPIKKPSKECIGMAETTVPSESQIRIEKLYVPIDEWEKLYYDGLQRNKNKEDIFAILKKHNDVVSSSGILYSIDLVKSDTGLETSASDYVKQNRKLTIELFKSMGITLPDIDWESDSDEAVQEVEALYEKRLNQRTKPFQEDLQSESVFLTYFPDQDTDLDAHAIGIVGGYKDTSTNAGYFLVPLALIADVVIVAAIIVACILVLFGGGVCF